MMTSYPPYKAPSIDPSLALLRNSLCTRLPAWQTSFGPGQAFWEILHDFPSFPAAACIELSFGEHIWTAFLSDTSCLLRHEAFCSGGPLSVSALPPEVQKAVLTSLFTPALSMLQESSGKSVSVRHLELNSSGALPSEGLGFKVSLSGIPSLEDQTIFAVLAPSQSSAADYAAHLLSSLPLLANPKFTHTVSSVPLEVALETGYLFLSHEEMKSIGKEDVLLPEVWTLSDNRAGLRIYHGNNAVLSGDCSLREGAAVLETPLAEEVDASMDSTANDIEIRLSFELDRRLITVGELASVTPGFTFPLTSSAESLVTVRANGKAVARGRLVDMNGTLGVQITETL